MHTVLMSARGRNVSIASETVPLLASVYASARTSETARALVQQGLQDSRFGSNLLAASMKEGRERLRRRESADMERMRCR